jgi:hypothetical protein
MLLFVFLTQCSYATLDPHGFICTYGGVQYIYISTMTLESRISRREDDIFIIKKLTTYTANIR